jgi:hypothetical protein
MARMNWSNGWCPCWCPKTIENISLRTILELVEIKINDTTIVYMKKFLTLALLACVFLYFSPVANAYTGVTSAKKHHKHHKHHSRHHNHQQA